MICSKCNFNNADGSAFCGACGAPLTPVQSSQMNQQPKIINPTVGAQPPQQNNQQPGSINPAVSVPQPPQQKVSAQAAPVADDGDEGATTILMATPGVVPKPVNPPVMGGTQTPVNVSGAKNAGQQDFKLNVPEKKPVQTAKNTKSSKGSRIYMAASIVVMAAMLGAIIFGLIHYNGKIKDLNDEKTLIASEADADARNYETRIASLSDANVEMDIFLSSLTDANSEYVDQVDILNAKVEQLEIDLAVAQGDADSYSEINKKYEAYDNLIEFSDSYVAQGNEDFFCSDSILHLKKGDDATAVYIYFYPEGELSCKSSTGKIVSYEWGDEDHVYDDNRLYMLYITPEKVGNTIITISNSDNKEKLKIYVSVEK